MQVWELFIIAVGLSMDAFAVSVCKGLSVSRPRAVHSLCCGLYFGAFQVLMPALGWLLGVRFQAMITSLDHWIAFALLGAIGFNMVRESRQEGEHMDSSFSPAAMLPLALATLCAVRCRCPGGGRLWQPFPSTGGDGGRRDPHPHGDQDSAGAPGHPGLRKIGHDLVVPVA